MSVVVKRLLLDALKSRELSIVKLSKALASVRGVEEVDIVVIEVDSETETIKVTVRGPQIDYNKLWETMKKQGVSLKGVDEISVAKSASSLYA